jgi:hypothetical protein
MRPLLGLVVIVAAARPAVAQPAPAGESAARQAEIRVELAWLADPLVCPYYPCARAAGGALEVGGHVPDEAVRVRALEVARGQCDLPLVDRLQVRPGLAVGRVVLPADKLQRAALLTVRAELPEHADRIQVSCSPSGQLAVAGPAGSLEDRLRVSRCLRRLPGCAAVVNLLEVQPGSEAPPRVVLGPPLLPGPATSRATVVARAPPAEPLPDDAEAGAGYVRLSPPQPEADPAVKLVAEQAQARLWLRVRQACPEAADVAVAVTSPGAVHVRLRVGSQAEGERLAARVRALPEMAGLSPTFEIRVGR